MQFENQLRRRRPARARSGQAVLDVERVAPTVPGAAGARAHGRRRLQGRDQGQGRPDVDDLQAATSRSSSATTRRTARSCARARRSRAGQGTADADVTMVARRRRAAAPRRRSPPTSSSAARSPTMGQGVLQDVSGRLIRRSRRTSRRCSRADGSRARARTSDAHRGPRGSRPRRPGEPPPAARAGGRARPRQPSAARSPPTSSATRARSDCVIGVAMLVAYLLGRRSAR